MGNADSVNGSAERVLLTKAAFARHRGCKPPYITRLSQQGKLIEVDGLIDRDASDNALAMMADPSKAAVVKANAARYKKPSLQRTVEVDSAERDIMANLPKVEPQSPSPRQSQQTSHGNANDAPTPGSYNEAKRDRERYMADRAKWDLDVEKGRFISRDKAGKLAFEAGRSWRDQLASVQGELPNAIVSIVKQHLPSAPAEAVRLMEHQIAQAVNDAHRAALNTVAKQISDLAASLDAAPN